MSESETNQTKVIWVVPQTHKKVKVLAAKKGMTMGELITYLISKGDEE